MSTLRQRVASLARKRADLRPHLLPLLREAAGDELDAGRTWDGGTNTPDDNDPYRSWGKKDSNPRDEYNKWYRQCVCPTKHNTNCGIKSKGWLETLKGQCKDPV